VTASTTLSKTRAQTYGLHVTRADQSDDAVVRVTGELDLATVTSLRNELQRALATSSRRIVVDLRALDFLDSTGIHALAQAHERCRSSRRQFTLLLADGVVRRTLEVCGMLEVLDHVAPEAVAA
jgi:anti-sigma B factor antagonist